jgi:hypothetical protein
VDDEGVGAVPLLERVGVSWVVVLPCGVFEVVDEEVEGVVPLLELVGVPCVVVLP